MHLTREELATVIAGIATTCNLEYAYYQFQDDSAQEPPFFVWFLSRNTDLFADNANYTDKEILNFELYTSFRDFALEKTFETALAAAGISYSKESNYVDTEKIYQIAYESEVIING